MKTKSFLNFCLLLCLSINGYSCSGAPQNEAAQEPQDSIANNTGDEAPLAKTAISFPENVSILLPRQYRKESTDYPQNVKDKEWLEIYKDHQTGKWIISKADLKISYGIDICVGDSTMIINSGHENAVLFFTPFEGLSKNIETVLEDKPLIPGTSVDFKMNGKNHSVSVFGTDNEGNTLSADELPTDSEGNIYLYAKNYKLSFSSDDTKNYSIAEVEEMHDVRPKIIWAGDLNEDGFPDMILDLSEHYESYHLYFFLSDKNDKEKPLKKIADAMVVFDC